MIKISPSMLSSDFARLGDEVAFMDASGADMIHLDVMDGHFVPNITFGAPVIHSLRKYTRLPFDTHLMIQDPLRFVEDFAAAGADIITFNIEADSPAADTIAAIRAAGCVPSLCVKPATPVEEVFPYLDRLGMVLVMTVEPGFGGQAFIPETLGKIETLRRECTRQGLDTDIQVDGGISEATIVQAARAGANIFVAGSAIFSAKDPAAAIQSLRALAQGV